MFKNNEGDTEKQDQSRRIEQELLKYLKPVLKAINKKADRRLVKTFFGIIMAIIIHRDRQNGLLLSELGAYLLGPEKCVAGTKRISNLLHSEKWKAGIIIKFLWKQGTKHVQELRLEQETALVLWDESVIEKPESLTSERLCAVRSSKAPRLKRIKPGYFNPPGGRPIFVPGFNWVQIMVIGRKGPPTLAHQTWWTTRGEKKTSKREVERKILRKIDRLWGKDVIHVWDRGFAGQPWLNVALMHETRFIMRWPKGYKLIDSEGHLRLPGNISKGKRTWEYRMLWDARHRCERKVGVLAFRVSDAAHQQDLWLVVARRKGQPPWYLLTTEAIHSPDDAWNIIHAYARRWQVEMSFRYTKTGLAFESPRLVGWQERKKLLMIATLCFGFLLSLLNPVFEDIRKFLLRCFCHRTGKRSRLTPAPLYRLRLALSFLWLKYPPPFFSYL